MATVATYFSELAGVLATLPVTAVDDIVATLARARQEGRTIFLLGNGGSSATASHVAQDLAKGTVGGGKPRLRAIALTDSVPLLTAWANDTSYERVFAEQLANLVQPGDIVICISGSGNSPNVLEAAKVARESGAIAVGLAGYQGGKLRGLVDRCVVVSSDSMQMIEDAHMAILHAIFCRLRDE